MLTVFCCVHPSHTDSRLHSFFAARVCGYLKCLHVLKVIVTFFFFYIIVTPVWWLAVEVFSMSQADEQLYSCRVCLELKLSPVTAPDFVISLHCFFVLFFFPSPSFLLDAHRSCVCLTVFLWSQLPVMCHFFWSSVAGVVFNGTTVNQWIKINNITIYLLLFICIEMPQ